MHASFLAFLDFLLLRSISSVAAKPQQHPTHLLPTVKLSGVSRMQAPEPRRRRADDEHASSWHLLAGALARATTAVVLMPIDTVKTRLQFQRMHADVRV